MASPDLDRTLAICDLLLGAAHADANFRDEERDTVRELLEELGGGAALSPDVEARIAGFAPAGFDLAAAAAPFQKDSDDDKRKLLHLVSAIHEADEELDLDEDAFLKGLGTALGLPADEVKELSLEFEVEELQESFTFLRRTPPPVPPRGGKGDIDVDLE